MFPQDVALSSWSRQTTWHQIYNPSSCHFSKVPQEIRRKWRKTCSICKVAQTARIYSHGSTQEQISSLFWVALYLAKNQRFCYYRKENETKFREIIREIVHNWINWRVTGIKHLRGQQMKVVFSSSTLCPPVPCREEGGCYRGGQTLAGKTQGLENKSGLVGCAT